MAPGRRKIVIVVVAASFVLMAIGLGAFFLILELKKNPAPKSLKEPAAETQAFDLDAGDPVRIPRLTQLVSDINDPGAYRTLQSIIAGEDKWEKVFVLRRVLFLDHKDVDVAVRLITPALNDPDPFVRCVTVRSLGELPASGKVELLSPLADDKSPDVRRATVMALSTARDSRAFDLVTSKLVDPDPTVRETALQSLLKMDAKAAEPAIFKFSVQSSGEFGGHTTYLGVRVTHDLSW